MADLGHPPRSGSVDDLRVLVAIPAYNEEAALGGVIDDVKANLPNATALVVDDGSHDRTTRVARAHGARVVQLPFNLGIGGAVQTGYRVGAEEGFDVVIQVDGDGQHPAAAARTVLTALAGSSANYVIGTRFMPGGDYQASRARRGGIRLFARLVSLVIGQTVTDATSGLRAADRQAIRLFADHYPHDYPEVEAVVLAKQAGLRIAEVPVDMRQRVAGRSSITPVRSLYYMIKVMLAVLVQCLGRSPTRRGAA